ncbi:hypothetical protein [uncultured Pontibacter sp.]|uniref:hypothetical protein n=1 Tax=uncultured Pontibacter sp. TaxID=453356 RepID=UPI002617D54A|nr:hypothetical protein [uncultured Pontibacter sp.]
MAYLGTPGVAASSGHLTPPARAAKTRATPVQQTAAPVSRQTACKLKWQYDTNDLPAKRL